jgi:transposase
MARSELVDDELWELVKPLLPDHAPQRTGRPPSQ